MKPTILFLRPFSSAQITVKQLKKLYSATKSIGNLITINNKTEEDNLRQVNSQFLQEKKTLWTKLHNYFNPPVNIQFITTTNEDWQAEVIQQIKKADIILFHIAPRKSPDFNDFSPMQPTAESYEYFAFSSNPVHEVGTGLGLLRELDYCKEMNLLYKVIVLIPPKFFPRVQQAWEILSLGTSVNLKNTEKGFKFMTPRITALDRSLGYLKEVHSIIVYLNFGNIFFKRALESDIATYLKKINQSQRVSEKPAFEPIIGIPAEPVRLPPDQKLKHIRFTRIETLTVIPKGEIVELSFDEVKKMHPDIPDDYTCPGCDRDKSFIFWFQTGLKIDISKEAWVFQSCKYCGHNDYTIPWNEAVRRGYVKE